MISLILLLIVCLVLLYSNDSKTTDNENFDQYGSYPQITMNTHNANTDPNTTNPSITNTNPNTNNTNTTNTNTDPDSNPNASTNQIIYDITPKDMYYNNTPYAYNIYSEDTNESSLSDNTINTFQVSVEENNDSKFESEGEICHESKTTCDADKCGLSNLHPILDPRFNMREAAKQCLLLEDHLNNIKKRCYDCIRKHFLIIDGLLEEAVSLEKDNHNRQYYRNLHYLWIKIEKNYAKNSTDSNNLDNVSKSIRFFRKPLVEKYFDTISEYDDT
jgi:hypothetical protein